MLKLTMRVIACAMLPLLLSVFTANGQTGFPTKQLRLAGTNNMMIDTTIGLSIPSRDSSLLNGMLLIVPNKGKVFGFKQTPVFADTLKFKIENLTDTVKPFRFSVKRDSTDDEILAFEAILFDSTRTKKALTNESMIVTVKPVTATIASSDEFESWFFAGTNFDLFNGAKPQEFFFRSNNLVHLHKNSYLQFAFYKNRYFARDSNARSFVWQNTTPILLRDTMYAYVKGYYMHKRTQTSDPLGLQLDYLYKIGHRTKDDGSTISFFVSAGFDVSSTSVTVENTFSNYDTVMFRTKNPDSTYQGKLAPFPRDRIQYSTGVGNLNAGFMCIYDDKKSNFKGQINGGYSFFDQLLYENTKGGQPYLQSTHAVYFQMRTFYTYKPLGISIGFEAYKQRNQLFKLNATLSKVVDIEALFKTFSPINSLSLK